MSDQNGVKQPAERKFHRVKQGQNRAKSGRSSMGVSAGLACRFILVKDVLLGVEREQITLYFPRGSSSGDVGRSEDSS
jgi:hypothetical protein